MIKYLKGFYDIENDDIRDFRWMQKSAEIEVTEYDFNRDNYFLKFDIAADKETKLIISADKLFEINLVSGWQTKFVPLDKICNIENKKIKFKSDNCLSVADDNRELSLMISNINIIKKEDAPKIILQEGFYNKENDGRRDFYWMKNKSLLGLNLINVNRDDYLLLEVCSTCEAECIDFIIENNNYKKIIKLIPGWQCIGISLSELNLDYNCKVKYINFICNWKKQIEKDNRELSIMVSNIRIKKPNKFELNSIKMHDSLFKEVVCDTKAWCFTCDTSAICNLRCAYCSLDVDIRKHRNAPKGIEKIKKEIIEYLPYTSKVQPYISGEPLCRNDMWNVLEELNKVQDLYPMREIELSTNGLLIDEKMAEKIIDSNITSLLISVNAATEETYKRIQGGDFNKLIKNLKYLASLKKERNKKSLNISYSYVVMRENIEELPDFIRLANKLEANSIQIWPLNANSMGIEKRKMTNDFVFYYKQQNLAYYPKITAKFLAKSKKLAKKLNVFIGDLPAYRFDISENNDLPYPINPDEFDQILSDSNIKYNINLDGEKMILDAEKIKKCYFPWSTFYITTDGSFAPCLHLIYKGGIGNVLKEGIEGVWNNKNMQELRKCIIEGKVPSICKNAQCPFI